jgi:hypothetical protein
LADYRFEPIGTVYCGYPPEVRLPLPMLGLAAHASGRFGQWAFDRGTLCGTAGVMAFVLSGSGAWEAARQSDAGRGTARRTGRGAWHPAAAGRLASGDPRAASDLLLPPRTCRAQPQDRAGRFWLAGDYVCADYPATLEAAVRSGVAAARGILLS